MEEEEKVKDRKLAEKSTEHEKVRYECRKRAKGGEILVK